MAHSYKLLSTDLEIAREKGFEIFEISENWPVSEQEFHKFSDCIRNLYSNTINNLNNRHISDIASVEVGFITQLINIFHYNYARQYCLTNNIDLNIGSESHLYLNPDWSIIEQYYSNLTNIYKPLNGFFRNNAKNIVFNRHLSIYKIVSNFFIRSNVVGIGSNDRIKQEYIEKNRLFCDNRDGYRFIQKGYQVFLKNEKKYPLEKIRNYVNDNIIKNFFVEIKKNNPMFIEGLDLELIADVWLQRFLDAYKIYRGLLLIDIPKVLFVAEVGKPHSKLITLAFQRRGCKVYNFHHGNDSVIINQKWTYKSLLNHCDNYVVDTQTMEIRFGDLVRNQPDIFNKPINFISTDSDYYANLRKLTVNGDYNKVMIMGYPMNLARYADDSYAFYYYKILLEHKLLSTIKDSGYHVTYKAHPDRLNEVKSIMDDVSDNIIKLPFEDVVEESGILIFTYVHTTTFCYALNLPIPIVLVESPGTPWYQDIRNTLEKRVAIVKTHVSNNEIIVDNDKLIDAIRVSKNRINLHVAKEITG